MYDKIKNTEMSKYTWLGLVAVLVLANLIVFAQRDVSTNKRYQAFDPSDPIHQELLRVAQLAVETDLKLESMDASQIDSKNDPQIANAMRERFDGSERIFEGKKNARASLPVEQSTFLEDVRIKVDGTTASLIATELFEKVYSGMAIGVDANNPINVRDFPTKGSVDHQFEFVLDETNSWILKQDLRLNDAASDPNLDSSRLPKENLNIFYNSPKNMSEDMFLNRPSASPSRSLIVQYAYRHVTNYNLIYRAFPNDCTNFTSQSLFAGGWSMVDGLPSSITSWYYLFGLPIKNLSDSWSIAEKFRDFCFYRNDRVTLVNPRELVAGDILQVKWNRDDSPGIHSMVITSIASDGDPRFTQHSYELKDRSFAELASRPENRNAIWYGWHLKIPGEISISRINPNSLRVSQGQGNGVWVTVSGANFVSGIRARVNQWQIASSGVQRLDQNTVRVWVAMNNNRGTYTLLLQNPDGTYARKNFTVS